MGQGCFRGFGQNALTVGSGASEGNTEGVGNPIGCGRLFVNGVPVGDGCTGRSIDRLLCPGLGVFPAGGSRLFKFDGGFAGGFVFGEGEMQGFRSRKGEQEKA